LVGVALAFDAAVHLALEGLEIRVRVELGLQFPERVEAVKSMSTRSSIGRRRSESTTEKLRAADLTGSAVVIFTTPTSAV
jgi:hypothetical protein